MKSSVFIVFLGVFAGGCLAQADDEGWQELPREDGKPSEPHQSHRDLPRPWGKSRTPPRRDGWAGENPHWRDHSHAVDLFPDDDRSTRDLQELEKCLRIADPLLQEPRFIVPINEREITEVCSQWSRFEFCLESYSMHHMAEERRTQFNRTIQPSMEAIHRLCERDPEYERAYLSNAECLRKVVLDPRWCGKRYKYISDLVHGSSATNAELCCSYVMFRDCTISKSRQICNASASSFIHFIIDRSLSFLLQQCKNYVPNARDCPMDPPSAPPPRELPQQPPVHPHTHILSTPSSGNIDSFTKINVFNTPKPVVFTTEDPFFINKTSFTWTTPTPRSTTSRAWRVPDNNLDGPESQQFRGESGSLGLSASGLTLGLLLGVVLWL